MFEGDRKAKGRYSYALTTYDVEDVRAALPRTEAGVSVDETPVMYCDSDGRCMFDDSEGRYVRALEALLNAEAARGRRLVQTVFREKQMIAIWEIRREEE